MLLEQILNLEQKLAGVKAALTRACDLLPEAVRGVGGANVIAVTGNQFSLSADALLPAMTLLPPAMEFGYVADSQGSAELLTREMALSPRNPFGVYPVLPIIETSYTVKANVFSWCHGDLVIEVECPLLPGAKDVRLQLTDVLTGFALQVPDRYHKVLRAKLVEVATEVAQGLPHAEYLAMQQKAVIDLQQFLNDHSPNCRGLPPEDLLTGYLHRITGIAFKVSYRGGGRYCVSLFNGKHHVYGSTMDSVKVEITRDGPQDRLWCDIAAGAYPCTVADGWVALIEHFRQTLSK